MMQIQWVVKTTPRVKAALTEAASLLAEGDSSQRVAARLLVEVFNLKRTDEMKERGI